MNINNITFCILFILLSPSIAFALVPHTYPGIYPNIVGRVFYLISCIILIVYLIRNGLHKVQGWRYIYFSIIFMNIWNLDMMFARTSDLLIIGENEGLKYFEQQVFIGKTKDFLIYLANFDYVFLNIATYFFYKGLKEHYEQNRPSTTQISSFSILPYFPIIIFDIVGSTIFLTLSFLCLRTSLKLLKRDKDNIIWNYMVWLTGSYVLYAFSRTMGYILRHFLLIFDNTVIATYVEPISGSINTLTFIWLGAISLFFIRMYPIYLKAMDDRAKIQAINADIINLNKELEDLVAERTMAILGLSVADKVRNPVAIIGCICKRLLKKEKLSERAEEDVKDAVEECKKLEVIVGDFENILKTRQRLFKYIDINDVIKEVAFLIHKDIVAKGIQLELNLSEKPMNINAQKNLLRAAIFHLLKNAYEATPSGGKIVVSTFSEADNIVMVISDTGSGVEESILQNIFEPFFSTRENRMGMGLPLVKQIVNEHFGNIEVESQIGKGTTFKLIFPVKWCVIADSIRKEVSNGKTS
ncbi:MAG: ATP-binding protein [Thermodesulfovibrionales bacterium]|nr:ATP-binding protein [Thermodesulfovibrionales bacterium]